MIVGFDNRVAGLYHFVFKCDIEHKCFSFNMPPPHTHLHPFPTHPPHFHPHPLPYTEPVSPDEDSESVCSSLDGSVCSEDGGLGLGVGGEEEVEEGIQFQLSERIDQLGDKK